MNLQDLAQFAVKNNNTRKSTTPLYEMSITEARQLVGVRNGYKKEQEDGSQALTLVLSKYTLGLDAIAKGATRINAAADQVEDFTAALLDGVLAGTFDDAIVEAQLKSDPANKPAPKAAVAEAPVGMDLSGVGADEETGEESDDVL